MPMWHFTDNPPLACYYIALAGSILGWSEIALHSAFLIPAAAVILGTRRLAGRFCNSPDLAALLTLFTPVFLISCTTVMCDVLMLAFWVWAIVYWIEGLEHDNFKKLAGAGILMALATMTKYFGFSLVPLLGAYGFIVKRRGMWPAFFLIPLAAFAIYQWLMFAVYGAPLSQAAHYISKFKPEGHVASFIIALGFLGGCISIICFFAPLLWQRKALFIFAFLFLALIPLLASEKNLSRWTAGTPSFVVQIQISFWAVCGVVLLALAIKDFLEHRDSRGWLLFLWILGTFFFTAFVNWTINGRSVLPMAPAIGILIARQLEKHLSAGRNAFRFIPYCLAAGAAFAWMVARADFLFATADRETVAKTLGDFSAQKDHLYFQGHWGFQYYMLAAGMNEFDVYRTELKHGDILAIPDYNTVVLPPSPDVIAKSEIIYADSPKFLTTMSPSAGAGFYASIYGPLPFAFGSIAPERVHIYFLKTNAPPQK